jgi:protein O-mannosyl-transferase
MMLTGRSRTLLICLALAAATLAVYCRVYRHEFIIYDDHQYITENPHVLSGLRWTNAAWAITSGYASNWHPLTWLSHMVDVQIFGLNAGRHHVVSLMFHVTNTLLLFLALNRLTGALWRSAFVAGLFGLHPVHVESVAWAAERKDVLSTFFLFLTLLAHERWARGSPKPEARGPNTWRWATSRIPKSDTEVVSRVSLEQAGSHAAHWARWYVLSLVFFALGLMSKPMLVTTPFVLLLLDYWPLGRMGSGSPLRSSRLCVEKGRPNVSASPGSMWAAARPLIWEKLPFFALAAVSSVVTFLVQKTGGAMAPLDMVPFSSRLSNAVMAYFSYVHKTLWPSGLTLLYLAPPRWPMAQVVMALLVLTAITAFVLIQARRRPYLITGWFWFAGTLVPVIGIVQVGNQFMADRYTYIPAIGLFVMITWIAFECANAWPSLRPLPQSLSKTLSASSSRTSSVTLSETSSNPSSRALPCLAFLILGLLALLAYRQVGFWQSSETVLGHCLAVTKDNFVAHNNLGAALGLQNRFAEAKVHVEEALRIRPHDPEMVRNMGVILCQLGRYEEAVPYLQEAVRLKPSQADVYSKVAVLLESQGKMDQAIACYRESLRLNPDQEEICNNLAWTLATHPDPKLRDGNEAVRLAEHACELSAYRKTIMVGTLAAAYAEAGRFPETIATAQKAIALATASGQNVLADRNRQLLELYMAGKPIHEPATGQKPAEK